MTQQLAAKPKQASRRAQIVATSERAKPAVAPSDRFDELRVLTDPVQGPRASPSRLAGPKRFQPVPVPPIDLVLVSHDHCDHLDDHDRTIRALARTDCASTAVLHKGRHVQVRDFTEATSA